MVYGILPTAFDILLGEKLIAWLWQNVYISTRPHWNVRAMYTYIYIYIYIIYIYISILCLEGREHGESIVVCVSPLNSLMMDQQWSFRSKGIEVECIGEIQQDKDAIKKVISGKVPLILITPESITINTLYRGMLLSQKFKDRMVTLAIDEAHCIKTW